MANRKKKGKKGRDQGWVNRNDNLDMANERMEKYYKTQKIVPESEWDAFMQALRRPLPSTFRVAGNREIKHDLNDAIKNVFVPQLESSTFAGEPLPVPRAIPWYPEGLAWHLDIPRKELRKSPEYKRFHSFLVYETEVGNISRQEAVSMLPPLFLDVRTNHRVIDLCAAPGSKTSQLLESMDPPTGILVANDSDFKRAQLLVHTCSRLPSTALMVTNLDASIFPSLQCTGKGKLLFDRVLADVPCSGDGTLRKNIGIWRSWSPMEGNGLHSLQLRILQRAMRMLRDVDTEESDAPRIVYSTCSLNPVENEAVVAAALNSIPGFELVDVSGTLPNLKRQPGLSTWCPAVNREVDTFFASYENYCASLESQNVAVDEGAKAQEANLKGIKKGVQRNRMRETHWPPSNAEELQLGRCMRVYPHLQDTGGFFIAIIQRSKRKTRRDGNSGGKKRTAPLEPMNDGAEQSAASEEPELKRTKIEEESLDATAEQLPVIDEESKDTLLEVERSFKENPYTFVHPDEPGLASCLEKLRISPDFPRENLYVRNPAGSVVRSLYLVNEEVKAVMEQTDHTKIRLISAGVKLFGKSDLSATGDAPQTGKSMPKFRVLNEGLLALIPFLDCEALITGDARVLRTFLETYYPLCTSFPDSFKSDLDKIDTGSHIIRFLAGEYGNTQLSHDLYLPLWKSEVSVSLMIDKKAKSALSLRFFGEDITVAGRKLHPQRNDEPETMKSSDDVDTTAIPAEGNDEVSEAAGGLDN